MTRNCRTGNCRSQRDSSAKCCLVVTSKSLNDLARGYPDSRYHIVKQLCDQQISKRCDIFAFHNGLYKRYYFTSCVLAAKKQYFTACSQCLYITVSSCYTASSHWLICCISQLTTCISSPVS